MEVMKSVTVEEGVVDEHAVAEPVRAPPPTGTTPAPATPAAEPEPDVNSRPESKAERGIVQRRVITPGRRSPNVLRVICRHVNDLRVRRLNHDCRLSALGFCGHDLLRAGGQVAVCFGQCA